MTKENRIVLPKTLQEAGVKWFHKVLMHPGKTQSKHMMGQHFTWKGMRQAVQMVCKRCVSCQLNKTKSLKIGLVPEEEAKAMVPWVQVCVDLIGPYSTRKDSDSDSTATLHSMTMVDPATGWFQKAENPAKTQDVIINFFENKWLTQYLYPVEIVMDCVVEFLGEFQCSFKK